MQTQHIGTVLWFNETKGYGFIKPDNGGSDVFVHVSEVERAGWDSVREGDRVRYELGRSRDGRARAERLEPAGDE